MKILIIEDDPIIARVYGTKYAAAGFEACTASDGEEGLQLLKTFKPDLVHLDLMVPKTNGVDIIKSIRREPSTRALPIIVLSNTYQNSLVREALAAGASRCVSKATCTPRMMLEIVTKFAVSAAEPVASTPRNLASTASSPSVPASPPPPTPAPTPIHAAAPSPIQAIQPVPVPEATLSSKTRELARHLAFQAAIHRDFAKRAPELIAILGGRIEPLLRSQNEEARRLHVSELRRTANSLADHAGIAGYQQLSEVASSLEALLGELLEKPEQLGRSSSRTIVDAVDSLGLLLAQGVEPTDGLRPPTVLVVEHDPDLRKTVVEALGRLDVATVSVSDPQAALRLLADNAFSLVFVDTDLPDQNGFDLCRELRKQPSNQAIPVVFVSQTAEFESREECVASGGNDLIAKPFLPMELALKASSLLRRRPAPQPALSDGKASEVACAA